MKKPGFVFFLFVILSFSSSLHSASQNKLISKKFDWKVAQTRHFDIHYYSGAETLLPSVAAALERSYERITPALGISIPDRTPFFLYLTHNEFEENNIVDIGEGTGGVTEAFKNRLLIFNDGTKEWLEHVIPHEFTHVCQFHVFYSGFWKSVRLLKSVLYPLWFVEGMSEYYSGEEDQVQREMVLRDAVTSKHWIPLALLHGFNHVKPHEVTLAYKTGEAAIDYIAREYGENKIGVLLENLSEKFDIASSLQEVLGTGFSELDAKLLESLEEKYEEEIETMKEPEQYGKALTFPDKIYPVFNTHPVFFPDGKRLVYLSDQSGTTELILYDLKLNRALPLQIQKRFYQQVETIHADGSAISISSDERFVCFAGESKQKDFLYFYDLKREKLKQLSYSLDRVYSPQFFSDDENILFVGMKDGVTDIYSSKKNGKELKKITDTLEDENDVRIFPDGKTILFSRERKNADGKHERDLWTLSLETGKETQITYLAGHEIQPAISSDGDEIIFIADQNEVPNLYRLSLAGGAPVQLTQVIGGNFHPGYSPDGTQIIFDSFREEEKHLYIVSRGNLNPVLIAEQKKENKISKKNGPGQFINSQFQPSKTERSSNHENIRFRGGRPYSFRASTDFFFPLLFYSSTDGLFLSAYWQASEMLGNHQIQAAATYASAFDFLNYQVYYSYLKYRAQLFLGFLGDTQESIFLTTRESRREDMQFAGFTYPLNRFDSVQMRFATTQRRQQFSGDQLINLLPAARENVYSVSYLRDVTQGRYLQTTSGYSIQATYEDSSRGWGSELDYRNAFLEYRQFIPTLNENTAACRFFGGGSFGENNQIFSIGGINMMRGYGRFDTESANSRFAISNLEYRFPLVLNMNYHLWFFFPDFLFKNIYGSVFTDNGILWDKRDDLLNYRIGEVRNSVGFGLRFDTFVLQTFALILQFDWAYRTTDSSNVFYVGMGPHF